MLRCTVRGTQLNSQFRLFWGLIAQRFNGNGNVVGYEIMNEPFWGNVNKKTIELFLYFVSTPEEKYLQSFYESIHKEIRKYDEEHIIFFDAALYPYPLFAYASAAFTSGPGGEEYRNRQVFSYHIYCPYVDSDGVPDSPSTCHLLDYTQVSTRRSEINKYGCGGMMTEFGALDDQSGSIQELNYILDLADESMHGFAYWQFKNYSDITTANMKGSQGFYYLNGSLQEAKVRALSRTYPMRISGRPLTYKYYVHTQLFHLEYLYGGKSNITTLIYFNPKMIYTNGIHVEIAPQGVDAQIHQDLGYLYLSHKNYIPKGTKITVNVSHK